MTTPKSRIPIDYLSSPLPIIQKVEIKRISGLLEELNASSRLCGLTGSIVVAEFGFIGDKYMVTDQLTLHLIRLKTYPICEGDREWLFKNESRRLDWLTEYCQHPFRKYFFKNLNKAKMYTDRMIEVNEIIHQRKECLCYSNITK